MIGLIGAMEEEVVLLRAAMKNTEVKTEGGFDFFSGSLEGKHVVLLRCGIGKVNAAVGCSILIHNYKTRLVINSGSAGGIDPSLNIGDAVIAEGLVYHDVDVTGFHYKPGQVPGQPEVFTVPENLILAVEEAIKELKAENRLPENFNYRRGIIGSGDVFMHQDKRIAETRRYFPDILAFEMESTAIAHTCLLLDVPAVIIRSISDVAGKESPDTFDRFLPVAAKHSSQIVSRTVRNLPD
ncbi:MAG: 5'-methylthioadenosine/S-adenosylhomocysteine nucleosidase [Treponema sp.]|jgi:adenosylhomocysteine nucleosidase|nr:5'-methylthioadenosine/S-adenosylhomocysteine nucleosidase [Treponema sp.]